MNVPAETAHRDLMDANYRWMKYVYDITRPTFLLGRNRLLRHIIKSNPRTVLEIGIGTGRNLKKLAPKLTQTKFYGSDISLEMLSYAKASFKRAGLLERINAIEADGVPTFPSEMKFDVVFFSYSLSMIPDWKAALRNAAVLVDPQRGQLLMVDFGGFTKWPSPLASAFHRNMKSFHVTARSEIGNFLIRDQTFSNWKNECFNMGGDWAIMHILSPPKSA